MVVVSNPGTYGTRKCSSWFADIQKDPEYKHPKIQHSKNLNIQNSKNPKLFTSTESCIFCWIFGFLDFWIFRFFDFLILDFLCFTFEFSICRNSSKIGFEKKGVCIGIYSVFKGCACRRGVTTYFYVYIHTHTSYTYAQIHVNT